MQSKVSLMDLIDAGLIKPGQVLRYANREEARAHVTPNGTVQFNGVEYKSLSSAAAAISNSSINGWIAWRFKSGNNWIRISELRDRISTT